MTVDDVRRCATCDHLVERIPPHPGSQGQATWRHQIPAGHHAIPSPEPVRCEQCHGVIEFVSEGSVFWRHKGNVAGAHAARPKAAQS